MKFIVFTRFAMKFDNVRTRYEERGNWVDYRMGLFKKYCLPSIQTQTFKEFDWWFLVHPHFKGFRSDHKNILEKYGKILWIDAPWKEDQTEVGELLTNQYKNEWICSTKVDSDDIIRDNFLSMVRGKIPPETECWINFYQGYMMKGDKVYPRNYTVNPFQSYVEYANPFRSCFRVGHTAVKEDAKNRGIPFITINDVPGWIQVDHGDNIKNGVDRKLKNPESQPLSVVKGDFTWNP